LFLDDVLHLAATHVQESGTRNLNKILECVSCFLAQVFSLAPNRTQLYNSAQENCIHMTKIARFDRSVQLCFENVYATRNLHQIFDARNLCKFLVPDSAACVSAITDRLAQRQTTKCCALMRSDYWCCLAMEHDDDHDTSLQCSHLVTAPSTDYTALYTDKIISINITV